ncbi:alpha/beta hydrolase, partial [Nonomuraea sp. NPDC049784]|uniref:alpha/beta fold hydrolase n=1 Tax=Nonomuraea sp. NPDC049784 TaxID=3154361 RepID=UPI0033D29504
MVSISRMAFSERATTVARTPAGPVEYRLEGEGRQTVVAFHGGHMRAGLALGEEVFADAGFRVLAPSRPGYGRTPLTTGTTPAGFADATAQLCEILGIERLAAVVGISVLVQVGPFKGWHEFGAQVLDLRNLVVIGCAG